MGRLRRQVRRRARGRCESCGVPTPPGSGSVDHRLPVALGGSTTMANLQLLCDECERAKTKLDLELARRARERARAGAG
jgi:5-methylcytosine-specific restriction endonuclease McrA